MKQKTRDDLIYVVVGLSIAAALAVDVFYAVSHDREIIKPPAYVLRASGTALITGYFLGRELRNLGLTTAKVVVCAVVAAALQFTIGFGFRQFISQLSSLPFVGLVTIETYLLVCSVTWITSHFRRPER